jgi:Protein of unknown function (DUF3302)
MGSTFGVLDAFAFVVFGVLLTAAVIIVVSLRQSPGQLARKWGHPQAAAVNVAGWVGVATGGLVRPLALIWTFMIPPAAPSSKITNDEQERRVVEPGSFARHEPHLSKLSAERRSGHDHVSDRGLQRHRACAV